MKKCKKSKNFVREFGGRIFINIENDSIVHQGEEWSCYEKQDDTVILHNVEKGIFKKIYYDEKIIHVEEYKNDELTSYTLLSYINENNISYAHKFDAKGSLKMYCITDGYGVYELYDATGKLLINQNYLKKVKPCVMTPETKSDFFDLFLSQFFASCIQKKKIKDELSSLLIKTHKFMHKIPEYCSLEIKQCKEMEDALKACLIETKKSMYPSFFIPKKEKREISSKKIGKKTNYITKKRLSQIER